LKAYKYKLRLNARFRAACERTLEVCRELYNAGLQERREAWRMNGLSLNYHDQRCLACGFVINRDQNAALNIKRRGAPFGESGRPLSEPRISTF
jgi:hypothetical protein